MVLKNNDTETEKPKKMRFLFIVQGEGRGHLTQAISLQDILVRNGHEVTEVMVGKSEQREIPRFFYEKIHSPISTYESPNFLVANNRKGILVYQSIIYNLKRSARYFRSMALINKKIKTLKPDLVINFYELLAGFTYAVYNPSTPYICIGHQLLLLHPQFVFPKGKLHQRFMLNLNTRLTSLRAKKLLALSFTSMSDQPKRKVYVVPPLLRREVLDITPENGNYLLGYMLNAGYSEEIMRWHKQNPNVTAHFFWDKKDAPDDLEVEPNLFFHRINDVKFLAYMKGCAGYASTSGFESICEAMYLRKPILLVPTAGHFEQLSNSVDAARAGAGITSNSFDINKLIEFIPRYNKSDKTFVQWAQSAEQRFISLLTT